MSREISSTQHQQAGSVVEESQQRREINLVEDTNNNTSLNDRERPTEGSAIESNAAQSSPTVREIHKNSWLKRMPCVDKWSGKFPKAQKLEKFWVVFCVHDDKEAFLEFYENRRSAYSHMPLSSISLSKCLHISPTIVAQGNDHEFVITLETQVIRLAASTNEQMLEWMDTLCTKLREMGILEPKDNLYSKEPINTKPSLSSEMESNEPLSREDFNRLTMRDPNSPLPPVPETASLSSSATDGSTASSTIVYIRNPSTRNVSQNSSLNTSSVIINSIATIENTPSSSRSLPETVFNFDIPSNAEQSTSGSRRSSISQTSPTVSNDMEQRTAQTSSTSSQEQSLYEPLFSSSSAPSFSLSIRNPNYENPPHPQRHIVFKPTPALPPRINSANQISSVPSVNPVVQPSSRASNLGHLSSTSEPSLNRSLQSTSAFVADSSNHATSNSAVLLRTQSVSSNSDRNDQASPSERHPHSGPRVVSGPSFKNTTLPVDENGRPLSLREVQVQQLQSEISHKSGVRLVLRKKDCLNAIAFVDCFNYVWVAGWKQKEHPLLHNTFHVGDRIISINGHRIQYVHEAYRIIKLQPSTVEFVVRRVPCGKILAIKREYEGQDLGIVREGGTAEVKEVKSNGLASQYGLTAKATSLDGNSLCNWVITEINHRPLNLFFKDNEVHDRLNAVGLDISILVQPVELIKALKKHLKAFRSYKEYLVQ
ncbi:uncharacterized protein [Parasteatoda tepidariorum]|uniref:uncharacterized protein n=1 Tax=Parasteatoda tepidariorum TaxID=114398 RepID=UPI001C7184B3|nr:uncharacterized protein LOC107447008 isoform X2 [Parasteatoda tepidariorum]